MKMVAVSLILLVTAWKQSNAQLQISATATTYTIDFTNTLSGVNEGEFSTTASSAVLASVPVAGELDADAWSFSTTNGAGTTATFPGSIVASATTVAAGGAVSAGGVFALNLSSNTMLGIQPTGTAFTPGTITLLAQNSTGITLGTVDVHYTIRVYNDQDRSNTIDLYYSTDNITYYQVPSANFTSTELGVASPGWEESEVTVSLSDLYLQDTDSIFLQWALNDATGGGSRDEFFLDSIQVSTPAQTDIWNQLLTDFNFTMNLGDTNSIRMEIGEAAWDQSDIGFGNSTDDPSAIEWHSAIWYEDGAASNKRVKTMVPSQLGTGTFYFAGRARESATDPWTFCKDAGFGNSKDFGVTYQVTIDNPPMPTLFVAAADVEGQLDLTWATSAYDSVLIVVRLGSAPDDIVNETFYTQGDGDINTAAGYVLYVGDEDHSATPLTHSTLDANATYFYKIFTVNNGFYSLIDGTTSISQTTLCSAPTITDPVVADICAGDNSEFGVNTTDGTLPITYVWQVNTGSGWADVSGGIYTNETTDTLNLSAADVTYDGNLYRVYAENACGTDTSASAELTVTAPAVISADPIDADACSGDTVYMVVAATGDDLTFEWEISLDGFIWNPISSSDNDSIGFAGVEYSMNGYQFRVSAKNSCDSVMSVFATLNVDTTFISAEPTAATTNAGEDTSFVIVATGAASYQWQVDDGGGWVDLADAGIYTGSSTNTLELTSVDVSDDGNLYRCVVTGTCLNDTSATVGLTVTNLVSVTVDPVNSSICDGANTQFSITASGFGISYQWQENDGGGWADLADDATYSGSTTNTLDITTATSGMDDYLYRCYVDDGSTADTSEAATLVILSATITIQIQPTDFNSCEDQNVDIKVIASGDELAYQWQVSTDGGSSYSAVVLNGDSSVFGFTPLQLSDDGNMYFCEISNSCASQNSDTVAVSVDATATVTVDPADDDVCFADNTAFSITATGDNLTYSWQMKNGGSWTDIADGGMFSGATTADLVLTGVTANMTGCLFRAIVSNSCDSDTSLNGLLLVDTTYVFIEPVNSTVGSGGSTSFALNAVGSANTYQWQVSEDAGSTWTDLAAAAPYSGVDTDILLVAAADDTLNNNQYRCVVTGACVNDTSAAATLIVNTFPAILTQPVDVIICEGTDALFFIEASSIVSALSYQWQVSIDNGSTWTNLTNGVYYQGTTNDTLTVLNAGPGMTGSIYRCLATDNTIQTSISDSAMLTVKIEVYITANPVDVSTCEQTNATFSVTALGTAPISYRWQENDGSGWTNISDGATYTGTQTNTLTLLTPGNAFDGWHFRAYATNNCATDTATSAKITILPFPTITLDPSDLSIGEGGYNFFEAAADNAVSYLWQVSDDSGSTWMSIPSAIYDTLNVDNASALMNGYYARAIAINNCGSDTSGYAILTITNAPAITSHPADFAGCTNWSALFVVGTDGTGLTYQWQISVDSGSTWADLTLVAPYLSVDEDSLIIYPLDLTLNGYMYRCVVDSGSAPTAYSNAAALTVINEVGITAEASDINTCDGEVEQFDITASGDNTMFQWQVNNGSGWLNITNGIAYSGATSASLVVDSAAASYDGYIYRCIVYNNCSVDTTAEYLLSVEAYPLITSDPANIITATGGGVDFTVTATGTGLTYQWQVSANGGIQWNNLADNSTYTGSDSTTLNVDPVTITMNGYLYRCIVNNTCGADTSLAVTLTVTSQIIQTDPVSTVDCEFEDVLFRVVVSGTGWTFLWQESDDMGSTWVDLSDGAVFSGTDTDTLSITSITMSLTGNMYRCLVGNGVSTLDTSAAAYLTVISYPVIDLGADLSICPDTSAWLTVSFDSDFTYVWSLDGSVLTETSDSLLVDTTSGDGTYSVIVTNEGMCASTDTVGVLFYDLPTVYLGPDQILDENSTVTLDAGAGFASYAWSTTGTNQTLVVDTNGFGIGTHIISVTVTDACGITATDQVSITFNLTATCAVCSDYTYNNASGWVEAGSSYLNLNYCDDANCSWTINSPAATGRLLFEFAHFDVKFGDTLSLFRVNGAGGMTLVGKFTNGLLPTPQISIFSDSAYLHFVSNSSYNGQGFKVSYQSIVQENIAETDVVQNLFIFPNPSKGLVTVSFASATNEDYQIRVIDLLGNIANSTTVSATNGAYYSTLNLENLPAGMYNIQITGNNGMVNQKIILE